MRLAASRSADLAGSEEAAVILLIAPLMVSVGKSLKAIVKRRLISLQLDSTVACFCTHTQTIHSVRTPPCNVYSRYVCSVLLCFRMFCTRSSATFLCSAASSSASPIVSESFFVVQTLLLSVRSTSSLRTAARQGDDALWPRDVPSTKTT
nr:hypothetical protein Iba_chr10aCG10050 [Ipomoea batatas]